MCQTGKKEHLMITHLWILSPASRWLHRVCSLDNLLRGGGGLVRGVVRALLHHVLTLLALWCGRARAFTQDWWAGGCALVRVTGSAKRKEKKRERKTDKKKVSLFILMSFNHIKTNDKVRHRKHHVPPWCLQICVDSNTAHTPFSQTYITWGLRGLKHHVLTWLITAKLIQETNNNNNSSSCEGNM